MKEQSTSFFRRSEPISLVLISEMLEAPLTETVSDEIMIEDVAPVGEAHQGQLSFFDNPKYLSDLEETGATACICAPKDVKRLPHGVIGLVCADPYRAFAKAAAIFYPKSLRPVPEDGQTGVSSLAYLSDTVRLEADVTVGPFTFIGSNVDIGSGSYIASGVRVEDGVKIGRNVSIAANVTLQHVLIGDRVIIHPGVAIGQDGFGFAMSPQGHLKVPQVGRVIVQDDVEIGANTTVDRGANRDTIIGEGTKIDNQVQIGHNVVIGRHCVIVSQVGISGSATLEDFVAIGGQSAINGHVTIGMGAKIAAVSAVHGDVPSGARWGGVPARPVRDWFKEQQLLKRMVKGSKEK